MWLNQRNQGKEQQGVSVGQSTLLRLVRHCKNSGFYSDQYGNPLNNSGRIYCRGWWQGHQSGVYCNIQEVTGAQTRGLCEGMRSRILHVF